MLQISCYINSICWDSTVNSTVVVNNGSLIRCVLSNMRSIIFGCSLTYSLFIMHYGVFSHELNCSEISKCSSILTIIMFGKKFQTPPCNLTFFHHHLCATAIQAVFCHRAAKHQHYFHFWETSLILDKYVLNQFKCTWLIHLTLGLRIVLRLINS